MSKEAIINHEERLRKEFGELMKTPTGKAEVKRLVSEATDYLNEIDTPEGYEESAMVAVREVNENRKMYFQHYSIIKQFVEFQKKLNKKDEDNQYIIF